MYIVSDGQYLKVGYSFQPEKRVREYQTGNARKLALIYGFTPDSKLSIQEFEAQAHKKLRQFRMIGEWFNAPLSVVIEAIETTQEETKRLKTMNELLCEGAGNYSSELLEVEDDSFGEW